MSINESVLKTTTPEQLWASNDDSIAEWLAFAQDTGVTASEHDYYGFSGRYKDAFKKSGLIIDSGNSYATDHPRTLMHCDKGAHIYSFMPYMGAFYDYRNHKHQILAYDVRQRRLENFVAYLNAKYPHAVMLCDVLPFSPHAPETMSVLFYNAYEVNPALFAKYSIMRVNGKACDADAVKAYMAIP